MDDKNKVNLNIDTTKKLYDSIPALKKRAKEYELTKVKQDIADAAEAKRNNLNFNVARWKSKFLFPFGNITPLPDKDNLPPTTDPLDKEDMNFKRLVTKYFYPMDKITKEEWLKEL